jgi:hypothetical protein
MISLGSAALAWKESIRLENALRRALSREAAQTAEFRTAIAESRAVVARNADDVKQCARLEEKIETMQVGLRGEAIKGLRTEHRLNELIARVQKLDHGSGPGP